MVKRHSLSFVLSVEALSRKLETETPDQETQQILNEQKMIFNSGITV